MSRSWMGTASFILILLFVLSGCAFTPVVSPSVSPQSVAPSPAPETATPVPSPSPTAKNILKLYSLYYNLDENEHSILMSSVTDPLCKNVDDLIAHARNLGADGVAALAQEAKDLGIGDMEEMLQVILDPKVPSPSPGPALSAEDQAKADTQTAIANIRAFLNGDPKFDIENHKKRMFTYYDRGDGLPRDAKPDLGAIFRKWDTYSVHIQVFLLGCITDSDDSYFFFGCKNDNAERFVFPARLPPLSLFPSGYGPSVQGQYSKPFDNSSSIDELSYRFNDEKGNLKRFVDTHLGTAVVVGMVLAPMPDEAVQAVLESYRGSGIGDETVLRWLHLGDVGADMVFSIVSQTNQLDRKAPSRYKKNANRLVDITGMVLTKADTEQEISLFVAKRDDSVPLCSGFIVRELLEGDVSPD